MIAAGWLPPKKLLSSKNENISFMKYVLILKYERVGFPSHSRHDPSHFRHGKERGYPG